jgi:uncharacterized protein (DUF58 family)
MESSKGKEADKQGGSRRSESSVILPAPTFLRVMVLPTLLSIATIFAAEYKTPVLILDGAILAVVLVDLLLFGRAPLSISVNAREILSIGQKNTVELILEGERTRTLDLEVYPDLPREIRCPQRTSRGIPASLKNAKGTLRYQLIPEKRGAYQLGKHHVRYGSPLGLWRRQESFPTLRQVRVYPDLAMIRTYELLARKHRQYALVRASRLRGGESEFARLRDYTSDDDYRFIDWKATARRNKLTTREFQLESDQNVFLVLDSGRLMTAYVGGMSQFDLALNSALLMAHVAQSGGDRVGLMCFDEDVRAFLPPQGGPKATARLVQATYGLHPTLVESGFRQALGTFDTRIKQRCLLVLFTQLLDDTQVEELSNQLKLLSRKHLPLVILLEDTDLSRMANGVIDSSGTSRELFDRGAAAELLTWKHRAVARLKETGAHVIESPATALSNRVINRYLSIKAQHAL